MNGLPVPAVSWFGHRPCSVTGAGASRHPTQVRRVPVSSGATTTPKGKMPSLATGRTAQIEVTDTCRRQVTEEDGTEFD